jgi:hypothetical protein
MSKNLPIFFLIFFCQAEVLAQVQDAKLNDYGAARTRVNVFLQQNPGVKRVQFSNGQTIILSDINANGVPIYETTDNSIAGANVGVDELVSGGSLGINLTGESIRLGVWDGGRVRNDHVELINRAFPSDGAANFDNHATHVTGTILATGINPSARGMAIKAEASTFDFDNDLTEMASVATTDQSGLLLSNHSYGTITGWHFNAGWSWFGDPTVSTTEDYKFGFYDSKARQLDQLTFNSPYYTVVKSAGNDRNNTGDGSKPPDPQFNSISTYGNAKNIITVGAVNKMTSGYTSPGSVQMTDFSSWGPSDDGRIKPDIVAPGVNLLSTFSTSANAYNSLSGTSMATPVVTGAIALLQQLFKETHGGRVMKSATVKALVVHTALEAGGTPGPDYQHGWGLLNAKEAAQHILQDNSESHFIIESRLNQGQIFEMELSPEQAKRIRVTLTWTDPAGVVPPISLNPTLANLVNDLDVSIVDESNEKRLPWILDPVNPGAAAVRGNNFRDNVEKIEFENPLPRKYFVVVTHKGQLLNSFQEFSLVIDYTPETAPAQARYWIGGSGEWGDPNHWSESSGGVAVGQVPNSSHKVIFDENSFTEGNHMVTLDQDYSCAGISIFTDRILNFDLELNTLTIAGNFINTSNSCKFRDGKVHLQTNRPGAIFDSKQSDFPNIEITVTSSDDVRINTDISCRSINLQGGRISFADRLLQIEDFVVSAGVELVDISNSEFSFSGSSEFYIPGTVNFVKNVSTKILIEENAQFQMDLDSQSYEGYITNDGGELTLISADFINRIQGYGTFEFRNSLEIDQLVVSGNSDVTLESGSVLSVGSGLTFNSLAGTPISIHSSGTGLATLAPTFHALKCFDFLQIVNVSVASGSFLNAGLNSSITGSTGWLSQNCSGILFPDFTIESPCRDSNMILTSTSTGPISNWTWKIGSNNIKGEQVILQTQDQNDIVAELQVFDNQVNIARYSKSINLMENNVPTENFLVQNSGRLISFLQGDKYYWLFDDVLVKDQGRSVEIKSNVETYKVLVFRDQCNRASDPFIVTSIESDIADFIYPNPVRDVFFVKTGKKMIKCMIYTAQGAAIESSLIPQLEGYQIKITGMSPGFLVAVLQFEDGSINRFKLIQLNTHN